MATSLITQIPIFVFSSQIGDIELSTDQAKIEIVVEDGLTKMFKTMLYAYNGKVTLVNIGEVLENYMRANGKVFTAFTVYYNTAEGAYIGSFNLNTQYCSHIIEGDVATFATNHFLTTLPTMRVPRHSDTFLSFLHGQENSFINTHCVFTDTDGNVLNKTISMRGLITDDIGVTTIPINYDAIVKLLKISVSNVDKVLSYTVEYNGRFCTYYVTDDTPDIAFTFKNCFNVEETIYLNAVTTTKTKVNRSMAISQGRHSFYDQSVDKTYEVETAPLTQAEAEWVEQLFISHSVRLGVASDTSSLPKVIITESTCEIDDNDEQLHKVKFTWQFEEQRPHLQTTPDTDEGRIFTEPYNHVFN